VENPAPEPERPNQVPDGRDPRPENVLPSQSSGLRFPFEPMSRGRDVITITSVGGPGLVWSMTLPGGRARHVERRPWQWPPYLKACRSGAENGATRSARSTDPTSRHALPRYSILSVVPTATRLPLTAVTFPKQKTPANRGLDRACDPKITWLRASCRPCRLRASCPCRPYRPCPCPWRELLRGP
jgi:hypothetical protein